jgi:hypothetical protein
MKDQQPIWKKGGMCVVYVSDFICKTIRQVKLFNEQICIQLNLSAKLWFAAFKARKIIYLGKGFDAWWDLKQLIEQIKDMITIFKHTYSDHIGIFVFNQFSVHKGFAEDALNINALIIL